MARPVGRWLETFMCGQYAGTFESCGYKTLQSVCQLDYGQLQRMGVRPEHLDKIMENVSVLRQSYLATSGGYGDYSNYQQPTPQPMTSGGMQYPGNGSYGGIQAGPMQHRNMVSQATPYVDRSEYASNAFPPQTQGYVQTPQSAPYRNSGGMERNMPPAGGMDRGMHNPAGVDRGMHNPGGVDRSMHNPGGVERSMHNPGAVERSMHNPGGVDCSMHNPGGVDRSMHNPSGVDLSMHNTGVMERGIQSPSGGMERSLQSPTGMDRNLQGPAMSTPNFRADGPGQNVMTSPGQNIAAEIASGVASGMQPDGSSPPGTKPVHHHMRNSLPADPQHVADTILRMASSAYRNTGSPNIQHGPNRFASRSQGQMVRSPYHQSPYGMGSLSAIVPISRDI